jgi:preprotein translocase subunit SecA
MYDKLAGMTGTADTEAVEFDNIYKLEVMVIPTNQTLRRKEYPDLIYRTAKEKYNAVIDEIEEGHEKGQPALVGTISIEHSEQLSVLLKKRGVPHVVLNAKYHEQEANIVAQAGRVGGVTIATNMAGRGTDILLGGNPEYLARQILTNGGVDPQEAEPAAWESAMKEATEVTKKEHDQVIELGGLHIIGTERHESRRIDNQLRGRAGRQGDPGSSRFYLSLEDDLMRIFGSDRVSGLMQKLGMEEGVPIEHGMVSKAIERSQKQVEARNFNTRKHLLEYDDVMNKQREQVYELRREALSGVATKEYVLDRAADILSSLLENYIGSDKGRAERNIPELRTRVKDLFGVDLQALGFDCDGAADQVGEDLQALIRQTYEAKEERVGADLLRQYERYFILNVIDTNWKNHLLAMDHLKEGIGLRGYGQRDPLVEYKRESFDMFGEMKERVEDEIIKYLYLFEPKTEADLVEERRRQRQQERELVLAGGEEGAKPKPKVLAAEQKVGRNSPCPCGSGKKYKKCCGAK